MNKTQYFIELCCISGILSIVSKFLGDIQISYIILLILILIDTILGLVASIKLNRFSSYGLAKFIKKVLTYSLSIATLRLLEFNALTVFNTSILSYIMVSFLEVIEAVSILENLSLLGVPISGRFIKLLLGHLKIGWLQEALKAGNTTEKMVGEIDEIIKYHIPTFDDKNMRRLLEIKFEACKRIIPQVYKIFEVVHTDNSQLLYYRIVSIMQLELDEIDEQWKKNGIPQKYIAEFNQLHNPKIDKCQKKIEQICFSKDTFEDKKEQIMDNIRITVYQTIFDAHKSAKNAR